MLDGWECYHASELIIYVPFLILNVTNSKVSGFIITNVYTGVCVCVNVHMCVCVHVHVGMLAWVCVCVCVELDHRAQLPHRQKFLCNCQTWEPLHFTSPDEMLV